MRMEFIGWCSIILLCTLNRLGLSLLLKSYKFLTSRILLNLDEVASYYPKNMLYRWKSEELNNYMLKCMAESSSYQTTKLLYLSKFSSNKCIPRSLETLLWYWRIAKKNTKPKTNKQKNQNKKLILIGFYYFLYKIECINFNKIE